MAKDEDKKDKKENPSGDTTTAPEDRVDHTQDDVAESKCPKCGEPVHEKRMTCPSCGHEYTDDDYETDVEPDEFTVVNEEFTEEGSDDAKVADSTSSDDGDDDDPAPEKAGGRADS